MAGCLAVLQLATGQPSTPVLHNDIHTRSCQVYHVTKLTGSFDCAAAGDEVAIRSALERYEDIDMNFAGSREAKLLKVRTPNKPSDLLM